MSILATQLHRPAKVLRISHEGLSFLWQIMLVASVEVADDLARGLIAQHDSHTGLVNAARVVNFETAHGIWVEPGWQSFFRHTHQVLGLRLDWATSVTLVNSMYTFGHVGITFAFALWIYLCRRSIFGFLRNTFLIANSLALIGYELYPMAPPRLTSGLHFAGHPYVFIDTLFAVLKGGKVMGTQIGYDEFAAMPSLHVAWALMVGLTLAWTLRPLVLRLLALLYPVLMTVTVVVTGNHYLMDGVGAAVIVAFGLALSVLLFWWRGGYTTLGKALRALQGRRYGPQITAQEQGKALSTPTERLRVAA